MKAVKIIAIAALVYVGIVVAFETLIGVVQPADESTLALTTFEEDGTANVRVLSTLSSDGKLYVAVNHWPRAWYKRALAQPDVEAELKGAKGKYRAVPVTGAEHDRVGKDNPIGIGFRILTGFPARSFVRLDPR